jgi:hypothetical protein
MEVFFALVDEDALLNFGLEFFRSVWLQLKTQPIAVQLFIAMLAADMVVPFFLLKRRHR